MSASDTSSRSSGVDLQTLVITAVASASAAYVTSEIWAPGTLASAAITPVIVALVKEALAKPADVVTRAVPVRGVVRSAGRADEPYDPIQPLPPPEELRVPQAGEIPGSSRAVPRHAWKVAIATGLLGFLVAAVIITVPEFVAGKAATGGDRQTTFFGGKKSSSSSGSPTTTTTTTPDDESEASPVEPTVSVPPVETTTVPPADTTTVPPAQTTPAPAPQPPVPDPQAEGVAP